MVVWCRVWLETIKTIIIIRFIEEPLYKKLIYRLIAVVWVRLLNAFMKV